eukprot:9543727-Lingulodinium_polyedra.AAC.1
MLHRNQRHNGNGVQNPLRLAEGGRNRAQNANPTKRQTDRAAPRPNARARQNLSTTLPCQTPRC